MEKGNDMSIKISTSTFIGLSGTTPTTSHFCNLLYSKNRSTCFVSGWVSCDVNPLPVIELADMQFTELEWCINGAVATPDVYQFRVTINGEPLDQYDVYPQWDGAYTPDVLTNVTYMGSSSSTSKPSVSNYR